MKTFTKVIIIAELGNYMHDLRIWVCQSAIMPACAWDFIYWDFVRYIVRLVIVSPNTIHNETNNAIYIKSSNRNAVISRCITKWDLINDLDMYQQWNPKIGTHVSAWTCQGKNTYATTMNTPQAFLTLATTRSLRSAAVLTVELVNYCYPLVGCAYLPPGKDYC